MKKYYKALPRDFPSDRCWSVTYVPDVWIGPTIKHSKLSVFDNLEDATNFAPHYNIWECVVINPHKPPLYRCSSIDSSLVDIEEFWEIVHKASKNKKSIRNALNAHTKYYLAWPVGTYHVDKLMLTKKLPRKKYE